MKGLITEERNENTLNIDAVSTLEMIDMINKEDLLNKELTDLDVVCGIAASGRTPYVMGAMMYAKKIGASVISVTMNAHCEMIQLADIAIAVEVGPEVIMVPPE